MEESSSEQTKIDETAPVALNIDTEIKSESSEKNPDADDITVDEKGESSDEISIKFDNDAGRICFSFKDAATEENSIYPKAYYSFDAKERLLLIFAENFRREFRCIYPDRSLVMAIANECGIQKLVSTTIRPDVFLYPELIDCWKGLAQFVADFITYEPLDDPTELVSRKQKQVAKQNKVIGSIFFVYSGKFLLNSFFLIFFIIHSFI